MVQIVFLVDATGSMGDEIARLQDAIFTIHSKLVGISTDVSFQFSLVSYRDKGEQYVVKGDDFTSSIDSFQISVNGLKAGGGGYSEDLESAMYYGIDSLSWAKESIKSLFILTDSYKQKR